MLTQCLRQEGKGKGTTAEVMTQQLRTGQTGKNQDGRRFNF